MSQFTSNTVVVRLAALLLVLLTTSLSWAAPDGGSSKSDAAKPPTAPTTANPFGQLRVKTPREQLPPLKSVRVRDQKEKDDRSRREEITVMINTSPQGAAVSHGGKLLGTTPLSLKAHRNSTPLDITIKKSRYMVLRTRIFRTITRTYLFKLSPAKI